MTTAETQLESFFAKYEPKIAKLGRALRAKLRARLPGHSEIVYMYENQHSLVISYSPTEKGYEAVCTLALYPTDVKLFFAQAPLLAKADPKKLLQGSAKTVRFVPMGSVADFERAELEALMAAALKIAKSSPGPNAKGSIIVKAEEQKQRARATKAARPAPKSRR
jgi:hypothetical protein